VLDFVKFPVTKTLLAALRRIQLPNCTVLIWVDAVCINQADIREKNEQISPIREIYGGAKEVVVWLGDGAGHS